jgi:hypothetical protein
MQRLTGLNLLHHFKLNKGKERTEIIKTAGYIKPNGNTAYTDFYSALLPVLSWERKKMNFVKDDGGSVTVKAIVQSIDQNKNYHKKNDRVEVIGDEVYVYYYNTLICVVNKNKQTITLPGNMYKSKSKSNKGRLNRILMRFCGCQLFQKNHVWYVYDPGEDKDTEYGEETLVIEFVKPLP